MDIRRYAAASGTLALHGAGLAVAMTLAVLPAPRATPRPVEVALLTPPKPEPPVPPRPPERPKPLPPGKTPAPAPAPLPAPAPMPPMVSGRPVDDARPATITAAAAPPSAPAAPRVSEGVPATPQATPAREPAPPQRTGPRLDASWSGNAPPPYPAMARRMGEEGEVRLDVQVGADGLVIDVRLKRSSGSRLLDQTAIDTVKKWRFSPATIDGKAVTEWYHDWKWVFRLEG